MRRSRTVGGRIFAAALACLALIDATGLPAGASTPDVAQLPVHISTGSATQVITVAVSDARTTHGIVQAWSKTATGGWTRAGAPATAYLGRNGLSTHITEGQPYTPIGSFPLTQAFGRLAAPTGTRLPYRHTTPADWWISQPGPLYNTLQHCVSACGFTRGAPNAHLYYVTPQYFYAIVIDYNRNPVVQGAGSGYFLHVTTGRPTNGCVATSATELQYLLRWLRPAAHPRILIGVTS